MKLIKPLIVSILQVFVVIGIYELLLFFFNRIGFSSSRNVAWGILLRISLFAFGIIVLGINYIWVFNIALIQKKAIWVLSIILFFSLFFKGISYTPYKTLLLICCFIVGFSSKFIIEGILNNKKKSNH